MINTVLYNTIIIFFITKDYQYRGIRVTYFLLMILANEQSILGIKR